jgi:hypothetical protein
MPFEQSLPSYMYFRMYNHNQEGLVATGQHEQLIAND